jgi:DNA polymerase III delta prime subunit
MAPLIILISGKQGSGKTTTARALISSLYYSYLGEYFPIIKKFADPLYSLHDTILKEMQKMTGEAQPVKDGALLQVLGTEWGRKSRGENIWVDILKHEIQRLSPSVAVVIDDCRFENEFDAFPNALRVRLEASEEKRKLRADSWRENISHPSETGLDAYASQGKFDLYIRTDDPALSPDHATNLILAQIKKKK